MNHLCIKEIAGVYHGGTPRKDTASYWVGDIPWVSPKDMKSDTLTDTTDHISRSALDNSATRLVPSGTILTVARSGVLAHSFPVAIIERPMAFNQDIKALVPDNDRVLPEYLFYFLRYKENEIISHGVKKGATVHSLHSSYLEKIEVPLPALHEQRRIVEILQRADSIRRLRKQAKDTAKQLIPALFVDMFGNPETNPRKWNVRKVSGYISRFEGGKNLKAGPLTDGCLRILKVSSVTSGIYDEDQNKPAPDGYSAPEAHFVRKGDLLFSRANTEEFVGATALVAATNGRTLLPDKIWRFVWAEEVEPSYVHALFQNKKTRQMLSKLATGTSASMRNISQAKLKNLELPFAPIEKQREFAEMVRNADRIRDYQTVATQRASIIFQALLNNSFSGAL